MEWNVYYYNINKNKIEFYNILGSSYFLDELKKMLKKYRDKLNFAKALRSEMMRRFWSRSEYELVIEITEDNRIFLIPWCGCSEPEKAQIDVTDDITFDWRGFAEKHINKQIYKTKAKIDVFDQLDYKWGEFVDYCWDSEIGKNR